jgi:TPP-dependent 2-oxoacid decarboxylase
MNNPGFRRPPTPTATTFLATRRKPVLLAGPQLSAAGAEGAFFHLAEALGCAVAVLPGAKGFFREQHPQFVGVYLGG